MQAAQLAKSKPDFFWLGERYPTRGAVEGEESERLPAITSLFLFFFSTGTSYNKSMQFRVPQNIAMEDRLVGPLTAIQFGILVIGGMASFLVFTSNFLPEPINQVAGGFMALITIILAIGKFNGHPMYSFFRYIIAFAVSPKTRVWRKTGEEVQLIKVSPAKRDEKANTPTHRPSKADIANLAAVVDSRGQYGMLPPETLEKKGK